jgi:hypothetical protein
MGACCQKDGHELVVNEDWVVHALSDAAKQADPVFAFTHGTVWVARPDATAPYKVACVTDIDSDTSEPGTIQLLQVWPAKTDAAWTDARRGPALFSAFEALLVDIEGQTEVGLCFTYGDVDNIAPWKAFWEKHEYTYSGFTKPGIGRTMRIFMRKEFDVSK